MELKFQNFDRVGPALSIDGRGSGIWAPDGQPGSWGPRFLVNHVENQNQ